MVVHALIMPIYEAQERKIMLHQTRPASDVRWTQPRYLVRSEKNARENNEDSFTVFILTPAHGQNPIHLLAVADGMGGHAYGELASSETLRKMSLVLLEELTVQPSINHLEEATPVSPAEITKALMNALEQANAHIKRMVEANKWGKAGSTLVAAAIWGNTTIVVNLGDSPLFHYQPSTGQLTKKTEDHTVAGVLLRAGLISPELAPYHEGRSRLEFFVGCPNLPNEDPVQQFDLVPGDLLLLCSDGVSGSLLEKEMAEIFSEAQEDLSAIADGLLQAAKDKGETDNQTLILWQYPGNSPPEVHQEGSPSPGFPTKRQQVETLRQGISSHFFPGKQPPPKSDPEEPQPEY
jgi:protein phosphatase